jgi:hypothetical protein
MNQVLRSRASCLYCYFLAYSAANRSFYKSFYCFFPLPFFFYYFLLLIFNYNLFVLNDMINKSCLTDVFFLQSGFLHLVIKNRLKLEVKLGNKDAYISLVL